MKNLKWKKYNFVEGDVSWHKYNFIKWADDDTFQILKITDKTDNDFSFDFSMGSINGTRNVNNPDTWIFVTDEYAKKHDHKQQWRNRSEEFYI